MRVVSSALILVSIVLAAPPGAADSVWVAAVAHTPGLAGTVWETDLAVLNSCAGDATVELRLHGDGGVVSETYVVAAGTQQIFPDVAATLAGGDASGALEVVSDVPVVVSSRTFNRSADGTYGQAIDGVVLSDGLSLGDTALLPQLRQDDAARTNIGVCNMGTSELTAEVRLFDRTGAEVGAFELVVPSGTTVQDVRPYLARFGRGDIHGGFATVTVVEGSGAAVYGSVVDAVTGDPTTVRARPAVECQGDIADRLEAIDGLIVRERPTGAPGYRYFELWLLQPVDHAEPAGPRFRQYMTLLHRGESLPMVYETLGYAHNTGDLRYELTGLLEANQLVVEHRYFGQSIPSTFNYSYLTIEQAAADNHRVAQELRTIYDGPWISTGASKGGMTAIFHRRFYPDDVEATVPYVAPISFGAPDARYVDFLLDRGADSCGAEVWAFQRELLDRRAAMLSRLEGTALNQGWSFSRVGGVERAFESLVVEMPFTFWQYAGVDACPAVPGPGASDDDVFGAFGFFVPLWYPTDTGLAFFGSYYHQAAAELGYPDLPVDHLAGLLTTDPLNLEAGLPPAGTSPSFDPAPMLDVAQWVATEGSELLFIYGENDPFTAGAFDLGGAADSYLFVDPGGTHGASIASLEPADRAQVLDILERWTGVRPSLAKARAIGVAERRGRWWDGAGD